MNHPLGLWIFWANKIAPCPRKKTRQKDQTTDRDSWTPICYQRHDKPSDKWTETMRTEGIKFFLTIYFWVKTDLCAHLKYMYGCILSYFEFSMVLIPVETVRLWQEGFSRSIIHAQKSKVKMPECHIDCFNRLPACRHKNTEKKTQIMPKLHMSERKGNKSHALMTL